jgi:hypothetical protein
MRVSGIGIVRAGICLRVWGRGGGVVGLGIWRGNSKV